MRRIERATAFKRDYRRAKAISRYRNLDRRLTTVLQLLVDDHALPLWKATMPAPEIGPGIEIAIYGPTCC
jgi:hypothetical protein